MSRNNNDLLTRAKASASLARAQWEMADASPSHAAKVVQHYTALDNMWSALLRGRGVEAPKIHKQKLDVLVEEFPDIGNQVVRGYRVVDLYNRWLNLRYDEASIEPSVAIDLHLLGQRLWDLAEVSFSKLIPEPESVSALALSPNTHTVLALAGHQRRKIKEFVDQMKPRFGKSGPVAEESLAAVCPASYIRVSVFSDRLQVRQELGGDDRFAQWLKKIHDDFFEIIMEKSFKLKKMGVNDDWALNVSLAFHGPPAVRIALDVAERVWGRNVSEPLD